MRRGGGGGGVWPRSCCFTGAFGLGYIRSGGALARGLRA